MKTSLSEFITFHILHTSIIEFRLANILLKFMKKISVVVAYIEIHVMLSIPVRLGLSKTTVANVNHTNFDYAPG